MLNEPFRFWCHKVLPLVYDDSLSYYELLCKLVKRVNETTKGIGEVADKLVELKEYVDHYFDSQEIQELIDAKLDEMVKDGTFEAIIGDTVLGITNSMTYYNGPTRILLVGDSSLENWKGTSALLEDYMHDALVVNRAFGGGRWRHFDGDETERTVWGQVNNYTPISTEAPNVVIVLCGSNDLILAANQESSTQRIGDFLGAPDPWSEAVVTGEQATTFGGMRSALRLIRTKWPKAQVYGITRADHRVIDDNLWNYFKFYEVQIFQKFGIPVIDFNSICNLAHFIAEQRAWANISDELHYTQEMNARQQKHLAGILNSGSPTTISVQQPSVFYVPSFADDVGTNNYNINTQAMIEVFARRVNWVLNHCNLEYQDAYNSLSGFAYAAAPTGAGYSTGCYFVGMGCLNRDNRFIILTNGDANTAVYIKRNNFICFGSKDDDSVIHDVYRIDSEATKVLSAGDSLDNCNQSGTYYLPANGTVYGLPVDGTNFNSSQHCVLEVRRAPDGNVYQTLKTPWQFNRIYQRKMPNGNSGDANYNGWYRISANNSENTNTKYPRTVAP